MDAVSKVIKNGSRKTPVFLLHYRYMTVFIFISFVAGVLTVLAPCVLPLFPMIVGRPSAHEPDPRRAFVIVGSLSAFVFLFALALNAVAALVHIPDIIWELFSGTLLFFFGLAMFKPALWDGIPAVNWMYRNSNRLVGKGFFKKSILGDALVGVALGPVFSSCNPTFLVVLALVLPAPFILGLWYLVAHIFGLCLALSAITLLGQKAIRILEVASDAKGWFKRGAGTVFMLFGISVLFGLLS